MIVLMNTHLSIVKLRGAEMEILKVSAKSSPNSVAGALAGVLRERGPPRFKQLERVH